MICEIPLTRGKVTVVDKEDFTALSETKWYCSANGYAEGMPNGKSGGKLKMHRIILGVSGTENQVDHINGDKLDNRKDNLRIVNHQQNSCNVSKYSTNKSGYKGVCWHKKAGKWMAYIVKEYKSYYLGLFESKRRCSFGLQLEGNRITR